MPIGRDTRCRSGRSPRRRPCRATVPGQGAGRSRPNNRRRRIGVPGRRSGHRPWIRREQIELTGDRVLLGLLFGGDPGVQGGAAVDGFGHRRAPERPGCVNEFKSESTNICGRAGVVSGLRMMGRACSKAKARAGAGSGRGRTPGGCGGCAVPRPIVVSCPLSVVGRREDDHLHASSNPASGSGSTPSEAAQRDDSIRYQRAICHSVGVIGTQPG